MSTVNTIGTTATASTQATQSTSVKNELGKNEFLKLLVTQLKYQDPMDPMEDKEFIAQMAQFSTLEQMQNINSLLEVLNANTLAGQAAQMLGKSIEWLDAGGNPQSGKVTAVKIADGQLKLRVGETAVAMTDVIAIKEGN